MGIIANMEAVPGNCGNAFPRGHADGVGVDPKVTGPWLTVTAFRTACSSSDTEGPGVLAAGLLTDKGLFSGRGRRRDTLMYDQIDLPELKRMVDLGERTHERKFWMRTWCSKLDCGTAGCLVGIWCMSTPGDLLQVEPGSGGGHILYYGGGCEPTEAISSRFNIARRVAAFLFTSHHGRAIRDNYYLCRPAFTLNQWEAVSRLRKYVRYVERKRGLFAEHDWLMSLSRRDRRERLLSSPRSSSTNGRPKNACAWSHSKPSRQVSRFKSIVDMCVRRVLRSARC
jgi:hypothetical protein